MNDRSSPDTIDPETAGLIERLSNWNHGHKTMIVSETIDALTRLSQRAENWKARATQPATPTGGEAVAWRINWGGDEISFTQSKPNIVGPHSDSVLVTPLYAAPTAMAQSAERCSAGSVRVALEAVRNWDEHESNPASYGGLPERIRNIVDAALSGDPAKPLNSTIPCHRGGHKCSWPACPADCDGRPGNSIPDPAQPSGKEAEFCYWLKGYLRAIKGRDELDAREANVIRSRLNEMLDGVSPEHQS